MSEREQGAAELRIWGVTGLPEIRPGDDLAELIAAAEPRLRDGDVVVVTSKVVSKAEGRLVAGDRQAAIDAETVRVVAERGDTRIVQTRHGYVLAAAGVDASNVPEGMVLLLPENPDASARRIRAGLTRLTHHDVAVIVSDTFGRPWRQGLTDVALGVAGLPPLDDLRGREDSYGRRLDATITAVADEVAGAAELVKGKLAGVPVAVVRGLPGAGGPDGPGGRALVRPASEDMFRLGTAEAARRAVRAGAQPGSLGTGPVPDAVVEEAVAAARAGPWAGWVVSRTDRRDWPGLPDPVTRAPVVLLVGAADRSTAAVAAAGAAAATIRLALAAQGFASFWCPLPGGETGHGVGVIAVGPEVGGAGETSF